jgi:hypothetical protein
MINEEARRHSNPFDAERRERVSQRITAVSSAAELVMEVSPDSYAKTTSCTRSRS